MGANAQSGIAQDREQQRDDDRPAAADAVGEVSEQNAADDRADVAIAVSDAPSAAA